MSVKHRLMPLASQLITSDGMRNFKRSLHDMRGNHTARFYFRVNDPHSWLLAQQLADFSRTFRLNFEPKVMLHLPEEMYPEPKLHEQWALNDAKTCAQLHNLHFPDVDKPPKAKATMLATKILLAQEHKPGFLSAALSICRHLWDNNIDELTSLASQLGTLDEAEAEQILTSRRDNFLNEGHYLTGTLFYGGEWYWGPDRLDHLARRLATTPQQQQAAQALSQWRNLKLPTLSKLRGQTIELFFSFRSPYSYIALQRVYKLAQHYRLKLKILPVLPMVMRGLPVPKAKRRYILLDAKREADLANVPFGKIVDPVGAGVERCMALCGFAAKQGKLNDFIFNAATDIWSRGVDVSTDSGLKRVLDETQLDWEAAKPLLQKDGWREWAEAHRAKMMEAGNWGVPSIRVNGKMFWGQDRLSALEHYLLTADD